MPRSGVLSALMLELAWGRTNLVMESNLCEAPSDFCATAQTDFWPRGARREARGRSSVRRCAQQSAESAITELDLRRFVQVATEPMLLLGDELTIRDSNPGFSPQRVCMRGRCRALHCAACSSVRRAMQLLRDLPVCAMSWTEKLGTETRAPRQAVRSGRDSISIDVDLAISHAGTVSASL